MEYTKLNQLLDNFINNPINSIFLLSIDTYNLLSLEVLSKNVSPGLNICLKKIDINTSINIVYDFFNSISEELGTQFLNIINSKDDDGKPYVIFLPKKDNSDKKDIVTDKRAYIYYQENAFDCFVIAHEMLHKMNECNKIKADGIYSSSGSHVFGELVSITGEVLLGKYMVDNYLINEQYFNYVRNNRLNLSKNNAIALLIEMELLNIKMYGRNIDEKSILSLGKNYDENSIKYKIFSDKNLVNKILKSIIDQNDLSFVLRLRYIFAQVFSNKILNSDNGNAIFLKLNDMLSNPECNYYDVYNYLISIDYNIGYK